VRVLLDECLPKRLRRELPGHVVLTVAGVGWAGLNNGDSLRHASEAFDVFVTVDRNLPSQQNLSAFRIAVVVLVAARIEFEVLQRLMPEVLGQLPTLAPGQLVRVGPPRM
jgi:hypothetical protein